MAKDDYSVIVCKILSYLYSCLKKGKAIDPCVLRHDSQLFGIEESYWTYILRAMMREELIEGLCFTKAWGNVYILASGIEEIEITPKGIANLKDNSKMAQILEALRTTADFGGIVETVIGTIIG